MRYKARIAGRRRTHLLIKVRETKPEMENKKEEDGRLKSERS